MSELEATVYLLALFALRCIVPLAFTLGVGYLMQRLARRWEEEAAEQAPQPASPSFKLPCWLVRNCSEEQRSACPVFIQKAGLCWRARAETEGTLPSNCLNCPIFMHARAFV